MGRPIRVLHITQHLEIGGLETLIVELCRHVDDVRFRSQVLCLNGYNPNYKAKLSRLGIPVTLIKKKRKFDLSFFKRVIMFLKAEKIDVVHAHGGVQFYSVLCGKLAGINKIIYTAHGLPVEHSFQTHCENHIFSVMVDRIVAVSEEIKKDCAARLPLGRKKLGLIINGVDVNVFRPRNGSVDSDRFKEQLDIPPDKIIIGSVGRLEKVKNYSMLFRAFGEFIKFTGGNGRLVLMGDGTERVSLERLAKRLGISQEVSFLGVQDNLADVLPILDVFALSSTTEGTSVSLLESQACGIPAVVTNVGGNGNIVKNGYNGFLCDVHNHKDMAQKFLLLANDKELFAAMRRNARATVTGRFNLQPMIQSYQ
ncbi:MAG: glycosyltransferase, partial [bacterium]